MKYIKSILEKEFSQDWFDTNPKNYLVKNIKELEKAKRNKKSFQYHIDNKKKNLEDIKAIVDTIDYKDIILKSYNIYDSVKYECSHPKIYDGMTFITIDVYKSDNIEIDDSFNRIHTMGIMNYLGLGLGYKAYKRVIKEIGFARSSKWRTNLNSRKIWTNLIKDPDFYVMTYLKREEKYSYSRKQEGVMVFHKEMDPKEIKKVIDEFSRNPKWVKIESYCEPLKKLLNI